MERVTTGMLEELVRIAPSLHRAGTFSSRALAALARHASAQPINYSVETGSGISTLLFSHLSEDHTVFAVDGGTGSIRGVESSALLRRETVRFVEGPTQRTLPLYTFTHPLQLALIDGPHGYPFPDLEYYYLYPHLERDALLILDDIHIPTITNLFEFLSADEMFDLQEVVETTAFFRRTSAARFPPFEDGWWTQGYNRRVFESVPPELVRGPALRQVEDAPASYLDRFGDFNNPLTVAQIVVSTGEELVVSGWALDSRRRRPAAAVDLVLDGVAYRTTVRVPRADVAAAHGDQAYFRSGFSARFPRGVLSPGPHSFEVRVILAGEREYYLAARLRFEAI
jgi:hypothetical protein